MPIPATITSMGQAAHLCGTFPLTLPNPNPSRESRPELTRVFHVYLELAMQAKHDALLRAYCQRIGVQGRPRAGTQVEHRSTDTAGLVLAPGGFYTERAETAADVVRDQMVSRWSQPQRPGEPVFAPGTRTDAAVQAQVQDDDYRYEISYWYDAPDVYVLFHCYP